MALVALLTDTHFGVRNDNHVFLDYITDFYDKVFFPYLDEHKIKRVIHLGDVVDRRKYINFNTAYKMRKHLFDPLKERDIEVNIIIGNHDIYYRDVNRVNSMTELYTGYNFNIIDEPVKEKSEIVIDGVKCLLLPWMNKTNEDQALKLIAETDAKVLFGHLELRGYEMNKGQFLDHGYEDSIFKKFDRVMSGHFHTKSHRNNIDYLGVPYQLTWADYRDPKGFHTFDPTTLDLTFIENPLTLYYEIKYDESYSITELREQHTHSKLENKIVRFIYSNIEDKRKFNTFYAHIQEAKTISLQPIDKTLAPVVHSIDLTSYEDDTTIGFIKQYVDGLEDISVDKETLFNLFETLYTKATHPLDIH